MERTKPQIPRELIAEFCRRNHIGKLSLMGSVLRADFDAESDIDILVEFEEGRTPGFFAIAAMQRELSRLFGGCKVDLRTPDDLSQYFRASVVGAAEPIYGEE